MSTSTEDKIFTKLDDIADRLARIETGHKLLVESVDEMGADVKVLAVEGCAKGKEHTRRLEELAGRPERTLSVVAVLISILSGAACVVAWIRGGTAP